MSHPALRPHARSAALLFAAIGLQVGAWSAGVAQVALDLDLSAGRLGLALAAGAAGGVVALVLAGRAADRFGRRPVAVLGATAFAVAWFTLGRVGAFGALVVTQVLYGAAAGLLDLAANAVGSDVERVHAVRVMPRLHAAFSGAAAVGALGAGAGFAAGASRAAVFTAVAGILAAVAAATARTALPPHREAAAPGAGPAAIPGAATAATPSTASAAPPAAAATSPTAAPQARSVLAIPGVLAATAIVTLSFLGDGALEGYSSVHLRTLVGAGPLAAGVALAGFYGAQTVARLGVGPVIARHGERRVLSAAGGLASFGVLALVLADAPPVAMAGLLVTGAALAPIVPVALSLAARSAPGRSGAAVSAATAVGWGAFLAGPPLVGVIADLSSLRAALGLVVLSVLAIAALARIAPGLSAPRAATG